jgi:hypothetical protein
MTTGNTMNAQEQQNDCIEKSQALGLLAWMELFSFGMYPANGSNNQFRENSPETEDAKRILVEPHVH